jgi:hypothetical protein
MTYFDAAAMRHDRTHAHTQFYASLARSPAGVISLAVLYYVSQLNDRTGNKFRIGEGAPLDDPVHSSRFTATVFVQ